MIEKIQYDSNLIKVRLEEIKRSHDWNKLMANLKIGSLFIPLFLFLLGLPKIIEISDITKYLNWSISYTAFILWYYLILFVIVFLFVFITKLRTYIIEKFTSIGKENDKITKRFLILKYYSITGHPTLEKYILDDKIDLDKEAIEAIINPPQRRARQRRL